MSQVAQPLIVTQNRPARSGLHDTLEPSFDPPAPQPPEPSYVGLIVLSLLTFLFLIFLLFKRRLQEVRFGILATVLLGILLPVWTIIEITTDLLVETPENPAPVSASPTATPTPTPTAAETEDRASLTETIALGLESSRPLELPAEAFELSRDPEAQTEDTEDESEPQAETTPTPRPPVNPPIAPDPTLAPQAAAIVPPRNQVIAPLPSLSDLDLSDAIAFRAFLRQGVQGIDVLVLQKILRDLGFFDAEPTGYFGPQTAIAVQKFQKAHNLLDDGIVGFSTCKILDAQTRDIQLTCPR